MKMWILVAERKICLPVPGTQTVDNFWQDRGISGLIGRDYYYSISSEFVGVFNSEESVVEILPEIIAGERYVREEGFTSFVAFESLEHQRGMPDPFSKDPELKMRVWSVKGKRIDGFDAPYKIQTREKGERVWKDRSQSSQLASALSFSYDHILMDYPDIDIRLIDNKGKIIKSEIVDN